MSFVNNNSLSLVPFVSSAIEQPRLHIEESLIARIQNVMDDSFNAQLCDYNQFHQYGMGDIVVLVGTSTAGKTSIIKALKQLESDRLEDGVDHRSDVTKLKLMTKYNPNEIETLKNIIKTPLDILKAMDSKERPWKAGVTPQEKMEAEEAILKIKKTGESFSSKELEEIHSSFQNMEAEMFDDAFEHSRRGGNIIFDVLNIDVLARHLLMRNFDGPIRPVLTYCPFHVLSSRMEKRNKEAVESGEFKNQRIGEFPLRQFSEIYTQKEAGQVALERLNREQVTKAFSENFDKGTEANRETARIEGAKFSSEKELSKEKAKALGEFLTNLGFKEGVDEVEVAPKMQQFYRLFINSNNVLPGEAAKIIHRGTFERY